MARSRVLAIGSDQIFLDFLDKSLNFIGCAVTRCNSGGEAVLMCRRECFDAAVVNLDIPEGVGEDICRDLKEICPLMPVVLVFGSDNERARERFKMSRADAFLVKSFEKSTVVEFMADILKLHLRRRVRMQVKLSVWMSAERGDFSAISSDISGSGIFVYTAADVGVGDVVILSFRVGDTDLVLRGRVVRRVGDSGADLIGLGIEFENVDPVSQEILDSFVTHFF